ncbi:MAG: hypothetical protein C4542_06105 [Dehalococcoidia bacterium]|nr:MAG: hypothetical protein C4542_06105 [Dehalococcoidia bacterium]
MPRILPNSYVGGRSASAADAAPSLGPLAQAADDITRSAAQAVEAQRVAKATSAAARATQEISELAFQLKNGWQDEEGKLVAPPPAAQHYQIYQDRVKQINKRFRDELTDDRAYALYESDFTQAALKTSFDVRSNATERMRGETRAELDATVDALAGIAATSDTAGRALAHTRIQDAIARATATGALSPAEGFAKMQTYNQVLSRADVKAGLMADPAKVALGIMGNDYPGITSPEERVEWLKAAHDVENARVTAAMAALDKARSESDRARRDMEEATAKSGYELIAQRKLTPQWVVQNRANLDQGAYKYLLEEASGATPVTPDLATYGPLRLRASAGEDVRREAEQALYSRRIDIGLFNTLVSEVEQVKSGATPPNLYTAGRKFLEAWTQPSELIDNEAAKQMAANAMLAWDTWYREHPDATRAEGEAEFQRIAYSATLVAAENLMISNLLPRGMGRTRPKNKDELRPALIAAVEKTEAMRKAKEIDEQEYRQELKLLSQWHLVLKTLEQAPNAK